MSANNSTLDDALKSVRLEREQLELQKLREELAQRDKRKTWIEMARQTSGLLTAIVTALGFLVGIIQYAYQQQENRLAQRYQSDREKETAEQELMKPWLENQRRIYTDALTAAATIATTVDPMRRKKATDDFWELYQGPMILVETMSVSGAMKKFGACLDNPNSCDRDEMKSRSLALGTAMAESMSKTARMTYVQFEGNQFKYGVEH
jgi:hypothetical protein